jgi:hypothetical protein
MSTAKQISANRRNAQKSTGPKTPEGKQTVSQNAVQHGWLARNSVLPHESTEEYNQLGVSIWAQYQPVPGLESSLVKRIVDCLWRLNRGPQIEVGIVLQQQLAQFDNCEAIQEERKKKVAKFRGEAEAAHPGALGVGDSYNRFMTLSRYEAHIEKRLRQTIELIERTQYARKSGIDPYYLSKIKSLPAPNPDDHSAKQSQSLETPAVSMISDGTKKVA